VAVGDVGGPKVAVGGLVISCSHCGVDDRWGRLLEGGLFCCVGVVIGGCAWLLPGKWQSSKLIEFGIFRIDIIHVEMPEV